MGGRTRGMERCEAQLIVLKPVEKPKHGTDVANCM
jgi:hypothetical protein